MGTIVITYVRGLRCDIVGYVAISVGSRAYKISGKFVRIELSAEPNFCLRDSSFRLLSFEHARS